MTNASIRKELVEKYFLVQFETFNEMRTALEEIFSPSAASVILYESAKKCGRHLCERLMEKNSKNEEVLSHLSKLKLEENWGKNILQGHGSQKGFWKDVDRGFI